MSASSQTSIEQLRTLLRSRFSQGVLWNIGSVAILGLSGVLINFIILTTRGETALGVFNQVYSIFMLTSQIGVGGIQFSVLKQISYNQDDRDLCGEITTSALILAVVLLLITCMILWLLIPTIGNVLDSDDVQAGLVYILPGIFFLGLNRLLNNIINGLSLMRSYAISQSIRYIIIPILVLLIALSSLETPYILLSFSIAEFVMFIGLMIYVYGSLIPFRRIRDSKTRFLEHISYAGRGFLSGVVGTLNTRIDIIMLGYFTSDRTVGIYSLASTLAEGFILVLAAIRWNIDPILGRYFSQGDNESINDLSRRIRWMTYSFASISALISIPLYPLVMGFFASEDAVTQSWIVFSLIMLGLVINSHYRVFKGILLQGDRPGAYTQFVGVTILVSVLLNTFLIPSLGLIGAAIATMLTYIIESGIMIYIVRRRLGVRL